MNRSAKATIFLLVICLGVLIFLLAREQHDNRVNIDDIQKNVQYGIVSTNEIDGWITYLEEEKKDTSSGALARAYGLAGESQFHWNNQELFSLAYVITNEEKYHDSLKNIWKSYTDASSGIRTFFVLHDADQITPASIDTLIGHMHQLSEATSRFQSFDFNE